LFLFVMVDCLLIPATTSHGNICYYMYDMMMWRWSVMGGYNNSDV
jgi:hypothetical protein